MPKMVNTEEVNAVADKIRDVTWHLGQDAPRDRESEPSCDVDVDDVREYQDGNVRYWSHVVSSRGGTVWGVEVMYDSGTVLLQAHSDGHGAFHYLAGDWEQRLEVLHQAAMQEKSKKESLIPAKV